MLRITIHVPQEGNVSLRTQAGDCDPKVIERQLEKARDAIQAELDAFLRCPIHRRAA